MSLQPKTAHLNPKFDTALIAKQEAASTTVHKPWKPKPQFVATPSLSRSSESLSPINRGDRRVSIRGRNQRRISPPRRFQPTSSPMSRREHRDHYRRDSRERDSRREPISIFVRSVADETTADDLRRAFERYGHVSDVYIPLDYYTKRGRGFAYVQFEDGRDANEAVDRLNGYRLHGRRLEVDFAAGDRKTPHQMRGKYTPSGGFSTYQGRSSSPHRRRRRSRSGSRSHNRSRSRSPRRRSDKRPRKSNHNSSGDSRPRRQSVSRSRSRSRSIKEVSVERSKSRSHSTGPSAGDESAPINGISPPLRRS